VVFDPIYISRSSLTWISIESRELLDTQLGNMVLFVRPCAPCHISCVSTPTIVPGLWFRLIVPSPSPPLSVLTASYV
jgi:hypothetical protein